ncbi:PIG-L family deacetylase [Dermatophilus congolensis]|uniref:PIG-L deacetylase family protein n=1 Tax=Dermatophilus congolensis TaxID=1863 RepID=UPI00312C7BF2
MSRTIVAVNAHPDDEALLMAGTLAKAAAAGDRVILVVATDGELGEADPRYHHNGDLGTTRINELHRSAAAIGAHNVIRLGYADSGSGPTIPPTPPHTTRFARTNTHHAATQLANILRSEHADLVIGYDKAGGYGHRDHIKLHEVVRAASATTGTRLLEATIPRELITQALRIATRLYPFPPEFDRSTFETAYTPRNLITHRITIGHHSTAKRNALRAHTSQTTGRTTRTLNVLSNLPSPLFNLILGHEWFTGPTTRTHKHPAHNIWDTTP